MRYSGPLRSPRQIRVPILPSGIILTDREDGTLWLLSHTLTSPGPDGNGYITIRTPMANIPGAVVYEAGSEPYLDNNANYRIIVRGGYLGVEYIPLPSHIADQDNAPIYTRSGVSATIRKIFASQGFIAWEPDTA